MTNENDHAKGEDPETMSILADMKACPQCGANLVGDEIEPTRREFFGGRTHYSRLVGVSNGDAVQWYECPVCHDVVSKPEPEPGAYRSCNVEVRTKGDG